MAFKKKETQEEPVNINREEVLTKLLMQKAPGIFDREPAPSFNGNLQKLVKEILELF